jgi:predicted alpha/beta-fold hydrolase
MHSHKTDPRPRWVSFVVLFGCWLPIHVHSAFLLDDGSKSLSRFYARALSTSGSTRRGIRSIHAELVNMSHEDDGWATIPAARKKSHNRNKNKNSNLHNTNNNKPLTRPQAATKFVPIHVEFIPPTDITLQFQPFMILLCGLPGSGKSTFARALEQAMPYKVRKRMETQCECAKVQNFS